MFKYLVFAFLGLISFSALAEVGVKVISGDSLEIDGKRVRLQGIDAPKYKQKCWDKDGKEYNCGWKAREFLKGLVDGGKVSCEIVEKDKFNREIGVCYSGSINLNKKMVLEGWAVSYDFKSEGFKNEEEQAKNGKKGLWAGKFMRPELYRSLNRVDRKD